MLSKKKWPKMAEGIYMKLRFNFDDTFCDFDIPYIINEGFMTEESKKLYAFNELAEAIEVLSTKKSKWFDYLLDNCYTLMEAVENDATFLLLKKTGNFEYCIEDYSLFETYDDALDSFYDNFGEDYCRQKEDFYVLDMMEDKMIELNKTIELSQESILILHDNKLVDLDKAKGVYDLWVKSKLGLVYVMSEKLNDIKSFIDNNSVYTIDDFSILNHEKNMEL